jgi:excisionase family DNA binding protein
VKPEPLLYDSETAADLLGVSRSTIYKLIARGELKGVKVGKARRFSRQELEALVERLEAVAGGAAYLR